MLNSAQKYALLLRRHGSLQTARQTSVVECFRSVVNVKTCTGVGSRKSRGSQ